MTYTLSIKHVPADVVERLRHRAKEHHRSLQGELLSLIEEASKPASISVDEFYAWVQQFPPAPEPLAVEIVRELRDAR